MVAGDIVLIPFPFSELSDIKVRPAVFVGYTKDIYKDVIVVAISSVVTNELSPSEILILPSHINNLRAISILKVDRIATLKQRSILTVLGKLNVEEFAKFKKIFISLID